MEPVSLVPRPSVFLKRKRGSEEKNGHRSTGPLTMMHDGRSYYFKTVYLLIFILFYWTLLIILDTFLFIVLIQRTLRYFNFTKYPGNTYSGKLFVWCKFSHFSRVEAKLKLATHWYFMWWV